VEQTQRAKKLKEDICRAVGHEMKPDLFECQRCGEGPIVLVKKTLQDNLSKFVGMPNTPQLQYEMVRVASHVLTTLEMEGTIVNYTVEIDHTHGRDVIVKYMVPANLNYVQQRIFL